MPSWRERIGTVLNRFTKADNPDTGFRPLIRSLAGTTVTHNNAFTLPAYMRGATLLGASMAQLPWHVNRMLPNGGRERAATHPVEWLLQNQANTEMTAFAWRETAILHALTAGNHYSEIEFNNRNSVINLWPLVPERVEPKRDDNDRLFYRVWNARGTYTDLAPSSVFHIHGAGWDGISGFDTIEKAGESLGLAKALEEFAATFFGNGANPGLVVKLKTKPTPDGLKRMRAEIDAMHGGSRKAHKVAFTDVGAEIEKMTTTPDDSQFLESRQHQVTEMSRITGVPPHLISDLTRSTNNNIEQQSREFLTYGLMPWVLRFEQEANRKLFGENRASFYTKMNVNAFMRGDQAARAQFYKDMILNGVFSVNEVRKLEDMDPIGPEGDVHLVQGQMTNLKDAGKELPVVDAPIPGETLNGVGYGSRLPH